MIERIWNELTWWQCLALVVTVGPLLGYLLWLLARLVRLAWSSRLGTSPEFQETWSTRGESRHAQERQAWAEAQAQFAKVMAQSRRVPGGDRAQ